MVLCSAGNNILAPGRHDDFFFAPHNFEEPLIIETG